MDSGAGPIKIGLQLIPQFGPLQVLRQQWIRAEQLGADVLYSCDHFNAMEVESAEVTSRSRDSDAIRGMNFEGTSIQAAMAATTSRAEIGCIVHANSYRNPNLMADIARTIDHISGGRYILGMGSGYLKADYDDYGYAYGTQKSRLEDLARDIPIIKSRLERLNPPPLRRLPLLIASMGEKIGMRIVAEHADLWNAIGPIDQLREKSDVLRRICIEIGRDFGTIERTAYYLPQQLGHGWADLDAMVDLGFRHIVGSSAGPLWDLAILDDMLAWRRDRTGSNAGAVQDTGLQL